MYRYFEELLGISIHVIVIENGKFQEVVPNHEPPYIWACPYPSHAVIFENTKMIYGREKRWYEVLYSKKKAKSRLFSADDPVVASIISQKSFVSVRPVRAYLKVARQFIDDKGKCRIVEMQDGTRKMTFTRPLSVDVIDDQTCFYDSHTRKLNEAKSEMGVQTIDLKKRSDNNTKYFPNDRSFEIWLSLL